MFRTLRFGIICLLAGLTASPAQAVGFSMSTGSSHSYGKDTLTTNRPWGNIEPSKPAPVYQPPQPLPGNYYLGAAPATGWYNAQLPGTATASGGTPEVETEIAGSIFYEQQNIIYTVRVVSDGNLASLNAEIPRIDGAALELIDGPVTTSRQGYGRSQQIVNTYRYKLMPVRDGEVIIPPIRFTGTHAVHSAGSGPDNRFSIEADRPLKLHVEPADPSVQPWLPLHDLRLQTKLNQDGPYKAGQPVTLTLELTARGALGTQLPSLASQLDSPHYRVYRDSTATQNGISANGRYLTGTRKETYTLIPLEDGWIRLPEVNVAWWDIDMQTARLAGLPPSGSGAARMAGTAAGESGPQPFFPVWFWMPMIIALALIAGFWLGAWHRTRPLLLQAGNWVTAGSRRVAQRSRYLAGRLSPVPYVRRVRMAFALLMPKSVRIWMCTRCLTTEENPEAWCTEFKHRVCEHLDISAHAPLPSIAEKLIATHPRAEPARLRELVNSLDSALYGGRPLDFPAWKRELRQQLRPYLLSRSRARRRSRTNLLPALNPHTA